MNHKWSDVANPPGLGMSRSMLRNLDSAEHALKSAGLLGAAVNGGAAADLACRLGRTSDISAGISAATIPEVKDAPGGLGAGIGGDVYKGVMGASKYPLEGLSKKLAFGMDYRPHPAIEALSGLARGISSLSSTSGAAELANVIPKLKSPRVASGLSGLEPGSPVAGSMAAVFGTVLSTSWKSTLLPDGQSRVLGSTLSGLLDGLGMTNAEVWRGAKVLSGSSQLFGLARGESVFGILGTGVPHGGVMPAFDAISRGLGGLFENIRRIDFEALQRALDEASRVREARRPRTKIGFAALEAYDALYMRHPWIADRFLTDYLSIEPDEDSREALWLVLRWTFERTVPRPAKWLIIGDEDAVRYLRSAVYKNVRRVRRDKEQPDRVWWTRRDPDTKKEVEVTPPTLQGESTLELMMKRWSRNPADIVVPSADERGRVLEMLYVEGSEQDRRVVGMFIAGFDLAAIAHIVGWPEVQRFQRKAQRWRENKL